ncbi:hypothetical protein GGR57DRAFT_67155 [Xylariaceae sp. FL1272]|nr:hypothetical protein GGR57DRAFT_67155 [Xylariaceae sp. FL1272]
MQQTGTVVQRGHAANPTDNPANGARGRGRQLPHDDTHHQPAVHSGRLVYAKPQDLPSFPSVGLDAKASAAGAAASLGWTMKSPDAIWTQEKSPSASTAAIMAAAEHKSPSVWEPRASSHGAKAALLASASQSTRRSESLKPSSSRHEMSAANQAFQSHRAASRDAQVKTLERRKSLVAAQGAVARRHRADSAPAPRESYPDEANAAANALSAATRAHRPAPSSPSIEHTGAVPFTTMNRLMFTSHPPVKPETDEQKRNDVLRASAVAMAQKMYAQQQKMIETKKSHMQNATSNDNFDVSSSVSDDAQSAQLTTLQDAAYKQAQARLAKMEEENAKNRDLRVYYGTKPVESRNLLSMGRLRRRSSSDGAVIEDRKRSQQIRDQTSMLRSNLSKVDEQKRSEDQEKLLAAAQRNVTKTIQGIDEKVAKDTGMVPPSNLTQWQLKAHAAARHRVEQAPSTHEGQVDIGGRYMDQEEINAIAARRVQPVLDEINEKAEKEQARQTEIRLDMERKKEQEEIEKARQKEIHDAEKKLKQQEKQEQKEKKAEEKQEAKARREEEKAAKAEQKRLSRAEKVKTTEHDQLDQEEAEPQGHMVQLNSSGQPVVIQPSSTQNAAETSRPKSPEEGPKSPVGDKSPGRVRTWIKSRFSRGSKSPDEDDKAKSTRRGFIGGASLTGMDNESSASLDGRSVRAVAMAGRQRSASENLPQRRGDPEAVSPLSSESEDEYFHDEARDQSMTEMSPPRPLRDFSPANSHSPSRDSRFHEII